jgi:hypothetical protein
MCVYVCMFLVRLDLCFRFTHASAGSPAQMAFVCRLFANWVARRKRTEAERTQCIPDAAAVAVVTRILERLSMCASSENKTVAASYIALLHNIVSWLGRFKKEDSELYPLLASALVQVLAVCMRMFAV